MRHKLSNVDLELKRADCSVCGSGVKIRVYPHRNGTTVNRSCAKAAVKSNAAWRARNPAGAAAHQLTRRLKQYELTPAEFADLEARAGGRCELCSRQRQLVIDHCHQTGRVRGLICIACNRALGILGDTGESLRKAVQYVERVS